MRSPSRPAPDALDRLAALLTTQPTPTQSTPADEGTERPPRERARVGRASGPLVVDVSLIRVVAGLALLALVAGGVATFLFLRGRPAPVGPPAAGPSLHAVGATSSPNGGASATASPSTLVVAVQGRVRTPGVVRVPAGSRVIDAIAAAGGARPGTDLATVNLAAKLTDGEQIVVGLGAPVAGAGGGGASGTPAGAVGLNSATAAQLDALPGVGPVMAQRIVDYRTAHGGFQRVDQLQDVPGIGPSKFTQLRDLVTL